ncbi:hypothetical protein HanRHA438_Chr06g0266561 [Helianthus annuus]|nr:hypothetical protein HanRHA438_Chr06g0266561 [Helianthus annuus]
MYIRHELCLDVELSAGCGDQSIHRVFVYSSMSHYIANVVGNGASETYNMHAKCSKLMVLTKLKGIVVNTFV